MRRSKPRFTDLQGQYLAFIEAYTTLHGVAPAEADMQRFFRVTPPAVHRMVLALEQRGLLKRVAGQARSIRLLLSPVEIPKLARHETMGAGPAGHVA
jgi:DNA-binding MarR family transcriptional regulator